MTPQEYCQNKAAQSGSSFYYSFLFLPVAKRRAITALYAFCREVDDIADECHDMGLAQTKLAWWRDEIQHAFRQQPHHPVSFELAPAIALYKLEIEDFHAILDGMEMDLTHKTYNDFAALQVYCYRVAGVVGKMAAKIFGYEDSEVAHYAENLGTALQLTNIIRDVGEDARRGRIYIPKQDLDTYGVKESDIFAARETANFANLMAFQIARAETYYASAFAKLPTTERKNQRTGIIMAAIYRTLLREIAQAPGEVLRQRIALTPLRKLWIAWKTWVFA